MDEDTATRLAELLGGQTWQSGGDIWLVLLRVAGDKLVVFSDEVVCEYADEAAFDEGRPDSVISLA